MDDCIDTGVGKFFCRLVKTLSLHSLTHYYGQIFDRNIHIMYCVFEELDLQYDHLMAEAFAPDTRRQHVTAEAIKFEAEMLMLGIPTLALLHSHSIQNIL